MGLPWRSVPFTVVVRVLPSAAILERTVSRVDAESRGTPHLLPRKRTEAARQSPRRKKCKILDSGRIPTDPAEFEALIQWLKFSDAILPEDLKAGVTHWWKLKWRGEKCVHPNSRQFLDCGSRTKCID